MKKYNLLLIILLAFAYQVSAQQLSGYKICIDPGHGGHTSDDRQTPLPHDIVYWESEGVFEVSHDHLLPMLQALGANVKLTRYDNTDGSDISLSARSTIANNYGADFFHSVHTNAGGGDYTLLLFKGYTTNPAYSQAKTMGNIMAPILEELHKTVRWFNRGDLTFLGYYLGVLKYANMPSTLSECSFHDVDAEGLRLKNHEYLKNYAWGMAKSFMQYWSKPGFSNGRVGGVVKDASGNPLNGVSVSCEPGGLTYTSDNYYNGFYAFGDLAPGTYTLTFSKAGYAAYTASVTISANSYSDLDITLQESNIETPTVQTPSANQSGLSSPVNFTWQMAETTGCDFRIQVAKSKDGWTAQNGFTDATTTSSEVPVNCGTSTDTDYSWSASSYGNPYEGPISNTKYWVTVRAYRSDLGTSSYCEPVPFNTFPAGTAFIDDFEDGQGHFTSDLTLSGTTQGIAGESTLAQMTGGDYPYEGNGSLEAVMVDDASSSDNWTVRMLSGGGNPANNMTLDASGKVTFWMKSYGAASGTQVAIWIDDSDGLEQSPKLDVINDGQYHKYEFSLENYNGQTITTGNGQIDGPDFTIDAIMFFQPNSANNWTVYIDNVMKEVEDGTPVASFTSSATTVLTDEQITFDAGASSDNDGSIVSYEWNFGDSNTATGENVSHTYSATGSYNVSLTVTDNDGKSAAASASIEVLECYPPSVTEVIIDNMDSECSKVGTWAESTSNPDFYGTNYIHDSGSLKGEKTVTFTPDFESAGMYEVFEHHTAGTNRATNVPIDINHAGGTSTVTINQQENNATWVSLGTYQFNAGTNGSVVLKNEGTSDVVIADAIKFVYSGCAQETTPAPVAGFEASSTYIEAGQSVSFTNASQNATSYQWTFEGGTPNTSTDQNPTVTYSNAGTYEVSLTATNDAGSDTKTESGYITVYSTPAPFTLKEEVRAVWLTTNWNLDWPTSGASIQTQKDELTAILDALVEANYNTLMFQVRSRGDLIYPSEIEPWAACFGSLGQDPGYDPLAFAIQEAHARGLEIHAWMCINRVWSSSGNPPSTSPQHVVNAHPEWVKDYTEGSTTTKWLDPGIPEVKTYLLSIVEEVATNYSNLDGIHFDYIRYPGSDFSDDDTYSTYGSGWSNKDDWRRDNINQFVYDAYDLIKSVNDNMKLGSAPIGIYQSTSEFSGWNGYSDIMQDSRDWMSKNKHDYVCPQIYWDLSNNPKFDLVAQDWIDNSYGKHIYTGHYASQLAARRAVKEEHTPPMTKSDKIHKTRSWSASEITNQIDAMRDANGKGSCFYRTEPIVNNSSGILDALKQNQYQYPANVPPMPWKDNVAPNAPANLTISENSATSYTLNWDAPATASDGDSIKYYVVYSSAASNVDISAVANIAKHKILNTTTTEITFSTAPSEDLYFVVTAYDEGNNESPVSNTVMLSAQPVSSTMIDDFETDEGHFNLALDYSGSTTGIDAANSSKARVTTNPKNGNGSLEIVLNDDANSTDDIFVRVLSGGGSPANNVSLPANGTIQLWFATSNADANAKIGIWLDDSDGIEQSQLISVNNDGTFHLYEWSLEDNAVWSAFTGNGNIDGTNVAIDAIVLSTPNGSSTWTMYIDDVMHTSDEPANTAPVASFTADATTITEGGQVNFDAGASSDSDGSIASYNWDFGDGNTATGVTASHTYSTAGTYTVRLTVTDDHNATATATESITVEAAVQTYVTVSCIDETVLGLSTAFSGTASSDVNHVKVTVDGWEIANETVVDGAYAFNYTFNGAGQNREVVATAYDASGNSLATDTRYIDVVESYVTLTLESTLTAGVSAHYHGTASVDAHHVIVKVDGWEIANETVSNGAFDFNYTLNTAGSSREFIAYSYDSNNNLLDSHSQTQDVLSNPGMRPYNPQQATAIEVQSGFDININLFPNPATAKATLSLSLQNETEVRMEVYDMQGRKLNDISTKVMTGEFIHSLDVSDYQEGIYLIRISGTGFNKTKKLIVRR